MIKITIEDEDGVNETMQVEGNFILGAATMPDEGYSIFSTGKASTQDIINMVMSLARMAAVTITECNPDHAKSATLALLEFIKDRVMRVDDIVVDGIAQKNGKELEAFKPEDALKKLTQIKGIS